MTGVSNILVPVDFSRASRKAMHYATLLASRLDAKLTAAHIVPPFPAFNYPYVQTRGEYEGAAIAEAKRLLPHEIPEKYRNLLSTETIVKCGDVRDELVGIVADARIDLIVMGTHGRRPLGRCLLGSVAESLLRRVPAPLLTVSLRGEQEHIESPFDVPFRRILYATDLSENDLSSGLHYCTEFARTVKARLTVLHVMDIPDTAILEDESELRARSIGELHKAIERQHGSDVTVATEVVRGTPHREILKFADSMNADLLVINLQSKSFLIRALLGSTAERVIRSSHLPVLSLPGRAS